MTIDQIISAARAFLPADSPLIEKMERAKELAGGFRSSPQGVREMMEKFGKTSEDLKKAIAMLDNPMVNGVMNRIAPGMTDMLRQAGMSLTGASRQSPENHGNGDTLAALRNKLSRL